VDVHIGQIRRKIEPLSTSPRYIFTDIKLIRKTGGKTDFNN